MSDNSKPECPICMDNINFGSNNCVTTECGHCFHANCLMQNVAHNGFGCPYCRTTMAEKPKKTYFDDDESYDDEDPYDEDEDDDEIDYAFRETMENYTLRGLRFMFNNLYGISHAPSDLDDEITELPQQPTVFEAVTYVKPPASYITQKLVDAGITFEMLVKATLYKDFIQHINNRELDNIADADEFVFTKMDEIISDYSPEEHAHTMDRLAVASVPAPATASEKSSSAAPADAAPAVIIR